jgi:hypothetical protein
MIEPSNVRTTPRNISDLIESIGVGMRVLS